MDKFDKVPSKTTTKPFIQCINKSEYYDAKPNGNGGKWLIFTSKRDVDEKWNKIRTATMAGQLGYSSMVTTAKRRPRQYNQDTYVIWVRTYESDDEEDVMRVRRALEEIGETQKLGYKTNSATRKKQFSHFGYKNICKWRV